MDRKRAEGFVILPVLNPGPRRGTDSILFLMYLLLFAGLGTWALGNLELKEDGQFCPCPFPLSMSVLARGRISSGSQMNFTCSKERQTKENKGPMQKQGKKAGNGTGQKQYWGGREGPNVAGLLRH
jgi:hypothetical protein